MPAAMATAPSMVIQASDSQDSSFTCAAICPYCSRVSDAAGKGFPVAGGAI